jgi:hypothetical protein
MDLGTRRRGPVEQNPCTGASGAVPFFVIAARASEPLEPAMQKNPINTIDLISLIIGEPDTGAGAPRPLPGHVEDRLASMGRGANPAGRRRSRRRAT